jgi:hypothetical protein
MVGFRVFDVGLLVVWLIWFFRLREDGDDSQGEDGGGGQGPDPGPGNDGPGGGGIKLPVGRAGPGRRLRDHAPLRHPERRRGGDPLPNPLPSRVRRPLSPEPAHRRS